MFSNKGKIETSLLCTVICQGVVQLGSLAPRFARGGPTKVGACKSFLFTESSHVVEYYTSLLKATLLFHNCV